MQSRRQFGINASIRFYSNILVIVKQTPYEQYLQSKVQGKAPVALRWERLKNRYDVHRECVDKVATALKKSGQFYFNIVKTNYINR